MGLVAGWPDLGLIASLGAFAAMFPGADHRRRGAAAAAATVSLIAATVVGDLVAAEPRLIGPVVAIVAGVLVAVWEYGHFGPPGVALIVMVCGLRAAAPSADVVLDAGLVGAVGVLAILLRLAQPRPERGRILRPRPIRAALIRPALGTVLVAGRCGVAVFVAAELGQAVGIERPTWAITAAATVLGLGSHASSAADRGMHRTAGTLLGVVVALPILALQPQGWLLVVLLTAFQAGSQLVATRNYALTLVVVTPLALLLAEATTGYGPYASVAGLRLVETVLGAGTAVAVSYVGCRPRWGVAILSSSLANIVEAIDELLDALRAAESAPAAIRDSGRTLTGRWRLRRRLTELDVATTRTAAERHAVRDAVAPMTAVVACARAVAGAMDARIAKGGGTIDPGEAEQLRVQVRELRASLLARDTGRGPL